MENQTSDKNIMGQVRKFRIPDVNSSLVPLEATITPNEISEKLPIKKTMIKSKKDPSTLNENIKSHPTHIITTINVNIIKREIV